MEKATQRQVEYLQYLRKMHGLEYWNTVKQNLGIITPGTYELTKTEASKLIDMLKNVPAKKTI